MDETEIDVAHPPAPCKGNRDREEADPALRIQRTVDRIEDDAHCTSGPEPHLAHFLRDEDAVDSRLFESANDCPLSGGVNRGRLVAALARAHHRLAVGSGWQLGEREPHVLHRSPAELEAISQADETAAPR